MDLIVSVAFYANQLSFIPIPVPIAHFSSVCTNVHGFIWLLYFDTNLVSVYAQRSICVCVWAFVEYISGLAHIRA